jgi:NAD(P)H-dependent flavin oxidoreductase YrpB (nitropropane dioxygenase family)
LPEQKPSQRDKLGRAATSSTKTLQPAAGLPSRAIATPEAADMLELAKPAPRRSEDLDPEVPVHRHRPKRQQGALAAQADPLRLAACCRRS